MDLSLSGSPTRGFQVHVKFTVGCNETSRVDQSKTVKSDAVTYDWRHSGKRLGGRRQILSILGSAPISRFKV